MDELNCKIYVDTPLSTDELREVISATVSGSTNGGSIALPGYEIDVVENADFDDAQRTVFPDGFVYFRHLIEVYAVPQQAGLDEDVLVTTLLNKLWSADMPAIAACDFEEKLPHKGGYKSPRVPWPAVETAA